MRIAFRERVTENTNGYDKIKKKNYINLLNACCQSNNLLYEDEFTANMFQFPSARGVKQISSYLTVVKEPVGTSDSSDSLFQSLIVKILWQLCDELVFWSFFSSLRCL